MTFLQLLFRTLSPLCTEGDPRMPSVSIVMVEKKHFRPEDIASQPKSNQSTLREYTTGIGPSDSKRATEIIPTMYTDTILEPKKPKAPSAYHKLDPALQWFINTVGCRRYLALAWFMSDSVFQGVTSTHRTSYSWRICLAFLPPRLAKRPTSFRRLLSRPIAIPIPS